MKITEQECGLCGADLRDGKYTKRIAMVDPSLDCVVAYRCPNCEGQEPRKLSEVRAVADPAAFRDVPPKR